MFRFLKWESGLDERKAAESFSADSSERCFACGCAGDGKGDNPGRNELIYCELCEDSWCDCCREPSCADKHEWYFCTRNAAESRLPPAEKAGITGITSGATMEGLETLLATEEGELCPDCADRCTHEDVAEIEVTDTTVEEDGVSIDVKCSCGVIGYVYGGKYDWDDWHEDTRLQHRPTFVSSAGFPGGGDDTGRPFQCPRCSGRFASETLLATDTFASMEWDEQNYAEGWYEDVAEGEGPEGLYIDLYVLNNPSKGTSLSEDISLTAYEWWDGLSDEEMDKVFADRKAEPIVLEWYVDSIPDYYYEPDDSDDTWGAEGDLEETQEELAEVRTELSKSRTGMSLIRTGLAIAGFVLLWEHHKWAKEEHDSKENRV